MSGILQHKRISYVPDVLVLFVEDRRFCSTRNAFLWTKCAWYKKYAFS